jgi:large exoprotein involved in heme utilization and adhesion
MTGGTISAATTGTRNAGTVNLDTASLTIANGTLTTSTSSTGNAGSITVDVGAVNLTKGSTISSNSTGTKSDAGDAGSVTINASGNFTSNGSTVSTSAENAKGGDIMIDAQNVQLSNGTLISASSNAPLLPDGAGNAGNITIKSASNVIMQNSSVTTEASQASGGQVTINASDTGMIRMVNSKIATSVAGSDSDTAGGDISIDPQFVILQNSQILAQAFAGTGGNITITSNVFLADPSSVVDASSQLGVSGTVDIRSPVSNLSGVVGRLPESLLAVQALLRAACAARLAEGQVSSFVERGRDSIPTGPDGLLASPYLPPTSEPAPHVGASLLSSERNPLGESLGTSAVQVRRIFGPDSRARVKLLSDDAGCAS